MLIGTVAATVALAPAIPGSASSSLTAGTVSAPAVSAVSASFAQSSDQREVLGTQLQPSAPLSDSATDNLFLAVLSLESATTPQEATASMERIVSLGVPQDATPTASLSEIAAVAASPTPAGTLTTATATAEATKEPECRAASSGAYCVYTVVAGDTLSGIAQRLGFTGNASLSAADMLAESNKPDVISSDHIEPGQNIRVPAEPGILHTVLFSETAAELADEYGVTLDDLLASPYNALGDGALYIGQEVFIPNPTQLPVNEDAQVVFDEPTPEPAAEAEAEPTATAEPTEAPVEPTATEEPVTLPDAPPLGPLPTETPTAAAEEPTATPTTEATPAPTSTPAQNGSSPPKNGSFFIWPTQGPISSYFGPSHPLGIDIDLYANPNADIVAARGGTVVFAGGDPCCSYGYYVIVDHGNGVQTLYAHFSKIVVSEGDEVAQGQLLGYGGRTGYATGNHLHFEIRVNGNVVDPLLYLP